MRKLGLLLVTGVLLTAMPMTVHAKRWETDDTATIASVTIPDELVDGRSEAVVKGIRYWSDTNVDGYNWCDVKRVIKFKDGVSTVTFDSKDTDNVVISIDSSGNVLSSARLAVEVVGGIECWQHVFLKEALEEWGPSQGIEHVDLLGYAWDESSELQCVCYIITDGAERTLKLKACGENDTDTLVVKNWITNEKTGEAVKNGTFRYAKSVYSDNKTYGVLSMNEATVDEDNAVTLNLTGDDWNVTYGLNQFGDYIAAMGTPQITSSNGSNDMDFSVNGKFPGRD